jgi:Tfp pilus assembly protein PilF
VANPQLTEKLAKWSKGEMTLAQVFGLDAKDMKGIASVAARYHEAEDDETAIKIYEGLIAMGYDLGDHHARLASAYQRSDQTEKAIRSYVAALQRKPNDLYILTNLGEMLMNRGRMGEAADLFKKVIELDPKTQHPAGKRARALAVKGNRTLTGKR